MFSLLQLVVLVYKWWGTVRHASWTFLLISQLEGFGLYVSTQSTCRRHSVKTKCNNFFITGSLWNSTCLCPWFKVTLMTVCSGTFM